jgi:c-di-GMP-binding flagellar brake protein YcgR
MDRPGKPERGRIDADALDALRELERSTLDAVVQKRTHARVRLQVGLLTQPASLSQRDGRRLQGVTGDLSEGGVQALLPEPLRVGDLYEIAFDRALVDLPPLVGRCLRARQVRVNAFEAGLQFLAPIDLAQAVRPSQAA